MHKLSTNTNRKNTDTVAQIKALHSLLSAHMLDWKAHRKTRKIYKYMHARQTRVESFHCVYDSDFGWIWLWLNYVPAAEYCHCQLCSVPLHICEWERWTLFGSRHVHKCEWCVNSFGCDKTAELHCRGAFCTAPYCEWVILYFIPNEMAWIHCNMHACPNNPGRTFTHTQIYVRADAKRPSRFKTFANECKSNHKTSDIWPPPGMLTLWTFVNEIKLVNIRIIYACWSFLCTITSIRWEIQFLGFHNALVPNHKSPCILPDFVKQTGGKT